MGSESSTSAQVLTYEQLRDIYDRIVDGLHFEEELINRRIGWMLAIQGVVLAGAGALLTQADSDLMQIEPLLMFVLFLSGSVSSLFTGAGVLGSKMAADFYRNQLWMLATENEALKAFPAVARLDSPTHNGRASVVVGRVVDCGLPWLVWVAWLSLSMANPLAIWTQWAIYDAALSLHLVIGLGFLTYYSYVWIKTSQEEKWRKKGTWSFTSNTKVANKVQVQSQAGPPLIPSADGRLQVEGASSAEKADQVQQSTTK